MPFQQTHADQHAFFAPQPLQSLHENVPHVAECPAVCGGVRQGDAADGVAYASAWSDPAHCGTGREHVRVYFWPNCSPEETEEPPKERPLSRETIALLRPLLISVLGSIHQKPSVANLEWFYGWQGGCEEWWFGGGGVYTAVLWPRTHFRRHRCYPDQLLNSPQLIHRLFCLGGGGGGGGGGV